MSTESKPWYSRKYNEYYNSYVPWLEDKYLAWFGENKTSYTAKEQLKTDVTGVAPVGKLQEGVAETVGGQLQKGGLLGGVGEMTSRQGVDRVERGSIGMGCRDCRRGRRRGWSERIGG